VVRSIPPNNRLLNEPPRLRRKGGFATLISGAATPPLPRRGLSLPILAFAVYVSANF
jgi:hypothetical protein